MYVYFSCTYITANSYRGAHRTWVLEHFTPLYIPLAHTSCRTAKAGRARACANRLLSILPPSISLLIHLIIESSPKQRMEAAVDNIPQKYPAQRSTSISNVVYAACNQPVFTECSCLVALFFLCFTRNWETRLVALLHSSRNRFGNNHRSRRSPFLAFQYHYTAAPLSHWRVNNATT